ncbi:MAG: hypothetical protein RL536_187, partial [Candidatus Parcubacteria bacterium]
LTSASVGATFTKKPSSAVQNGCRPSLMMRVIVSSSGSSEPTLVMKREVSDRIVSLFAFIVQFSSRSDCDISNMESLSVCQRRDSMEPYHLYGGKSNFHVIGGKTVNRDSFGNDDFDFGTKLVD